jgi:hypothetical protein
MRPQRSAGASSDERSASEQTLAAHAILVRVAQRPVTPHCACAPPARVDGDALALRTISVIPAARTRRTRLALARALTSVLDAKSRPALRIARALRERRNAPDHVPQICFASRGAIDRRQAALLLTARHVALGKRTASARHRRADRRAPAARVLRSKARARIVGRRRDRGRATPAASVAPAAPRIAVAGKPSVGGSAGARVAVGPSATSVAPAARRQNAPTAEQHQSREAPHLASLRPPRDRSLRPPRRKAVIRAAL